MISENKRSFEMKIVKFGGSSLATGESVAQAIQIILSDPQRQVMVVSAPGKRNTTDIKVTDLLIKYADLALKHKNCVEIVNKIFVNCNNKLNTYAV